ncbi:polysaccharide biosynthesis C-terminal domain-containing protein [Aurantibacillus circumpalustris]|uniref:polysaccharide biosynthesis C-terminal domain-containing protein n=1 Tax=Aurantibacillus circumpalustris TaxID=3036359 RepID=UPI00295C20FD|nr:polysaccharide biosynthesis C-terminal domain-containing protein [Aurantibacillus circumpalustris]
MFKNIIYSLITKGSVAIINFIILIISSRYLGVSSRGEISIFILNITVIQIVNDVYTGYSIVHFIPKFNFIKIIVYGVIFTLILCSLSNSLLWILNKQVKGYEWVGYILSLLVILNTFNCVLLLGNENIKAYNFLSFIQPFLLLFGIGFYLFVLKKYTFDAFVYPLLFSFSFSFLISTFLQFRFLKRKFTVNKYQLKPILVNGFMFQVATLTFVFVNRYSYYLLPDISNVGLYSSASSLMEAVLIIVNGIFPVLLARVSNAGNTPKIIDLTLVLSKASFLFSTMCVLILLLIPDSFFVFILGEGFHGIKNLMLRYSPGILLISLFGSMSYYFSAIGKQKLVFACYSIGFISSLIFAPFLISRYGVNGAAHNANIAYLLIAIAVCSSFMRITKLSSERFFSFRTDYKYLKDFIFSKEIAHL